MAGNSFGKLFKVTCFGESHGAAVGVVIDGVPPAFPLELDLVQAALDRRRPGIGPYTSKRAEADKVLLLSGTFEGKTTGAPLCLLMLNEDARPGEYDELKRLFRPGHADYSTWLKYGIRDHRGGGRSAGRETAARVAAGAVAAQLLAAEGVSIVGHVIEIGGINAGCRRPGGPPDAAAVLADPLRCACPESSALMAAEIEKAMDEGDSLGGIVEVWAAGVPPGLGEPVFDKLDALLAAALMSIGSVKAVEVGEGFALARMRGSEANDQMGGSGLLSNRAGGILGGVSTGEPIVLRLAVKPTPSIRRPQRTVDLDGVERTLSIVGRHDPCIAPRLVPVAEAMTALVLVDALLIQRALGQGSCPPP